MENEKTSSVKKEKEEKVRVRKRKSKTFLYLTFILVFTVFVKVSLENNGYGKNHLNGQGYYKISNLGTYEKFKDSDAHKLRAFYREEIDTKGKKLNELEEEMYKERIYQKQDDKDKFYSIFDYKRYSSKFEELTFRKVVEDKNDGDRVFNPNTILTYGDEIKKQLEEGKVFFWDENVDNEERELIEFSDYTKGELSRVLLYSVAFEELKLEEGYLELILGWHKQYPPKNFEINFQSRIKGLMEYSNPFVEHPWMVHLLFENANMEDLYERN